MNLFDDKQANLPYVSSSNLSWNFRANTKLLFCSFPEKSKAINRAASARSVARPTHITREWILRAASRPHLLHVERFSSSDFRAKR